MKHPEIKTVSRILATTLILTGAFSPDPALSQAVSEQQTAAPGSEYSVTVQEDSGVTCASGEIFSMDTYITVTCYGEKAEEAAYAALEEIDRIDSMLSVGDPDSEIAQINENGSGEVSEDTSVIIQKALELYESTEGAFDITIYPMMVLWGFTDGDFKVPDPSDISKTLERIGSGQLHYENESRTLTLGEGQGIDLGGIAKGFTSDRLMEIFEEYDLQSGLVNLGGNVQCYHAKPDGTQWKCGIRDPNDSSALLGVLKTADCAVITSGGYERFFTDDATGIQYHHIIDPKTGYPADNGLISVSIVGKSGLLADGLSTSCYIMGLEKSIEYWKSSDESFDMILMSGDGTLYVTEGIYSDFSPNYPCTEISR